MKKRILSGLLALCLAFGLLCTGAGAVSGSSKLEAIRVLGILEGDETGSLNLSSQVTRAEFAVMLAAASAYGDSVSSYGSSLFTDVKSGHWASGYVRLAVEQGWMSGYVDGTFRPDQSITLEEGCTALLRLLGYDASSLTGSYPAAQLSKADSLGLLDDVTASQGTALTRQNCVDLLYNALVAQSSTGGIYAVSLGYTVTNGEIDYATLVSAETKGPYVSTDGSLSLPFSLRSATVYRNDALSSADTVEAYDVYYYNEGMGTVWVYHDWASGTLTALSPSKVSPTSATVAGVTYEIGTSQAAYQLSSQGQFQEGDLVTLLLGMNREIVEVLDPQDSESTYYGSVVSSTKGASTATTSSSATASAQVTTQVACTDGVLRTFYHSGSAFDAGRLVSVSVSQSGTKVQGMSLNRLEGTVSADGSTLGKYTLASDVEILDTDSEGGYVRIYPSRLAGATLSGEDVRCYTLNSSGEIDRLILNEVTGDTLQYVYLSSVTDNSTSGTGNVSSISVSYSYIQDGQTHSLSGNTRYNANVGGAVLLYEDGTLKSISQLSSVSLDSLGSLTAMSGNQEYPLAEDVQVLLRDGTGIYSYYPTTLSQIDTQSYDLTGWYDDLGCCAGGRIRVIVAVPK